MANVDLTLVHNAKGETNASGVFTITGASLGATATDRFIVVAVGWNSAVYNLDTVTVAATSASPLLSGANGAIKTQAWAVALPTGTTGDVVLDFSGDVPDDVSVGVFRLTTTLGSISTPSHTDTASASGLSVTSNNMTVPTGGAALYIAHLSDDQTVSWSANATVSYNHDCGIHNQGSAALLTTITGNPIVTATDPVPVNWSLIALAWAPQEAQAEPDPGDDPISVNPYSQVSISSYNANPADDDGSISSNNQISWAKIKTNLFDPTKTALQTINTNIFNAFATSPFGMRPVLFDAGTITVAPLRLQSGTNLTTPLSGAWEYDGKVLYSTRAASQRGVSPSIQFVCNPDDYALADSTVDQSPFAPAADFLTVIASTTYLFDSDIYLTTGTSSHTTAFGLSTAGTSFTSILYWAETVSGAATAIATAGSWLEVLSASATVLNAASTDASIKIRIIGIMRVNAGGTIVPFVKFSGAPGGTNLAKKNSYFRCYPIGTNTVTSVGNWA